MEVVAIVPARDHASTRYRLSQFADHLAGEGIRVELEPLATSPMDRVKQVSRNRRDRIVVLQRKLIPVWQMALLRRNSGVLVYDFDDAVYSRDSFHRYGPCSVTRMLRFQSIISWSDLVFAGNDFLATAARRRTDPAKVHVLPTCVDPGRYTPAEHAEHRPTRLVWIGSSSTLRALESARPLLEEIGRSIPNLALRVICDRFPRFRNLKVEQAHWSSATEPRDLGEADIGISWIPDDDWSRGKCGLKVLQYMAAGLPVVASPVGVHGRMLGGGSGFLARDGKEWVERIGALAADHRLRRAMGHEGRARLEREFHVDAWAPVLTRRLREASERL